MAFTNEVIQRTKRLEKLLVDRGATGRGLHERATSIAHSIEPGVLSRLRFIATVRNKLMHEADYKFDGTEHDFLSACDEVISQLAQRRPYRSPLPTGKGPRSSVRRGKRPREGRSTKIWSVVLLAAAAGGAFLFLHVNPSEFRRSPLHTASTQKTSSVEEAQREALRRYPDLAIKGSRLNTAYVGRYNRYKQQRPEFFRDSNWPLRLADEVAGKNATK